MTRSACGPGHIHDYFRLVCRSLAEKHGTEAVFEHRFHPVRRWRFDAAYPSRGIAVELDGGVYAGGRHVRGAGFEKDCEKINEAQVLGWDVYRFTVRQMQDGAMLDVLDRALGAQITSPVPTKWSERRNSNDLPTRREA
jgi:very-short-patch-repair endonuclease